MNPMDAHKFIYRKEAKNLHRNLHEGLNSSVKNCHFAPMGISIVTVFKHFAFVIRNFPGWHSPCANPIPTQYTGCYEKSPYRRRSSGFVRNSHLPTGDDGVFRHHGQIRHGRCRKSLRGETSVDPHGHHDARNERIRSNTYDPRQSRDREDPHPSNHSSLQGVGSKRMHQSRMQRLHCKAIQFSTAQGEDPNNFRSR